MSGPHDGVGVELYGPDKASEGLDSTEHCMNMAMF